MKRSRTAIVSSTAIIGAVIVFLAGCGAAGDSEGGTAAPARGAPEKLQREGRTDTARDQTSTFALDVDTASYGYARRQINDGKLPDTQEIRPEEFVNSFRQDYPEPDGDGFSITADGARLGERRALVRVGLRTRGMPDRVRRPANLTFVIDVSGSMAEAGRLDLVKESLHALVDRLRPADRVALVTFSDTAETVSPMTSDKAGLREAIDSLGPQASTNLGEGVVTGYEEAAKGLRRGATNRVILLSDGLANNGDTSEDAILKKIDEHRRRGITLLGVGVGREYGDRLMERLADKGDGMAVYIGDREEGRRLFGQGLAAGLEVRARDAKAQVTFDRETVKSYRLVGYKNRAVADEDFRDDAVDGGEVGPGHSVTALYDVRLAGDGQRGQIGQVSVRWLDPDSRRPSEATEQIDASGIAPSLAKAPPRMRVSTVAAAFAEELRDGSLIKGDLASEASRLAALTEDPKVTELAALIRRARELTK